MYLSMRHGGIIGKAKVMGFRAFHTNTGDINLYLARLGNNSYVVVKQDSNLNEYNNFPTYSEAYLNFHEKLGYLESVEREHSLMDGFRPYSRLGL